MRPGLRGVVAGGALIGAMVAVVSFARCRERELRAPPAVRQPPAPQPTAIGAPDPFASREGPDAQAGAEPTLDSERSSEQALMQEAARLVERSPQQALTLIEAADGRFGSAVEARRKLEIEALVRLQRIGLAHAKAERFYRAFPDSPSIREIERRTGYHPRPTGPTR